MALSMSRSRSAVEDGSLPELRVDRNSLKESARVLKMLMPVGNSKGMRKRRKDQAIDARERVIYLRVWDVRRGSSS